MQTSADIAERLLEALLAGKFEPGSRFGEQDLAAVFGCSRTMVREALTRLSARGLVNVSPRRGWYVVEVTREQAQEVFESRRIIEVGILNNARQVSPESLRRLDAHIKRQKASFSRDNAGLRSFLLGDFHVCLAQCLGNSILAESLRDLTVRTTLAAMRFQSWKDATRSFNEHREIVEILHAGDLAAAASAMSAHLGTWDVKLSVPSERDSVSLLREALQPVDRPARDLHTRSVAKSRPARPARSTS
ncbi:GntR family transcriptional regulator [Bradyrhizobium uaiense]|uniref:GntR family transcriptional regulator n=1 Tax=Bradyrhizobium uaiense TaxID=2594946 RepID=A0A6P1BC83_9BRAD|nr:GntR family transcriptional regulator [Bradyrhizobium uaiense]NEU95814.1 GntR family transcriptional regulator [Bradyrhizobium uaiense]